MALLRDDAEERRIRIEQLLTRLQRQTNALAALTRNTLRQVEPTIQEARTILDDSRRDRHQRQAHRGQSSTRDTARMREEDKRTRKRPAANDRATKRQFSDEPQ
jgi:hypothetical protein